MNIFILDDDFETNCSYYMNAHVVKMITEHTQMLSTVCRLNGHNKGYKITHQNHPCTKWVSKSLSNWIYLYKLNEYLHEEWRYRFNHSSDKFHKSFEIMKTLNEPKIEDVGLTEFAQAMPNQYKHDSTIKAYRKYYNGEKQHIAKWKKRSTPFWFNRKEVSNV